MTDYTEEKGEIVIAALREGRRCKNGNSLCESVGPRLGVEIALASRLFSFSSDYFRTFLLARSIWMATHKGEGGQDDGGNLR